MKRSIILVFALSALLLSGCAAVRGPLVGIISSNVTSPVAVNPGSMSGLKKGTATASSILGIIASGDASIAAACENGNITQVVAVDCKTSNILGFYAEYTTIVYGK